MATSNKRLFAAIKVHPSEDFLGRYFYLRKMLAYESIKWVSPENIHITLKFFGETAVDLIPRINKTLTRVSMDFSPFPLELEELGIFGSKYQPRVLWIGIKDNSLLESLGNAVLDRLEPEGWPRDRQNFVPHLTLARIKKLKDRERFQKVIDDNRDEFSLALEVSDFHLFESRLSKTGPEYIKLETYEL
jgi:2'-5' RNA ligase